MIKIGSEFKYPLSTACLRSGVLTLPYKMRGLFPDEGEVVARDAESAKEYSITIVGNRRVAGFKDFIDDHNLKVNDNIVILLDEDGSYILRPQKSVRTVKKALPSQDLGSILDELYRLELSHSEPEICELYGLSDAAAIHDKLMADERFNYQSGRWHIVRKPKGEAKTSGSEKQVSIAEAGEQNPGAAGENVNQIKSEQSSSLAELKEFFRKLGYSLAVIDQDKVSIKVNLGRKQYGVLIHSLAESSSLDWTALLNQRRNLGLDYIAIFADHRDLIRLVSPAKSARVSLWSWRAFHRLLDYSKSIAIGPFDLEPHFAIDGLYEAGFAKFERKVREIIATRGRFSAVLERLATMKASRVFLLDDIQLEDYSREDVLKVLDLLEQSPFQIVQKIAPGQFFLRQPVRDALDAFADYALSLKARLPKHNTHRVIEASEEESLVH